MNEDFHWLSEEDRAHAGWRRAAEFTSREGLPNLFAKIADGRAITVAYLGGSITEQAGWRVYSLEFLRRRFPGVEFSEVQAAIGGTDSTFGAYRLGKDVLTHRPDLMFVEFATNDGSTNRSRDAESLVRRFFEVLPDSDICFAYTVGGELAQTLLERGWCNVGASAYEDLADHYGIPSIHMGVEAARLATEGRLRWRMPHEQMVQLAGDELNKTSNPVADTTTPIAFSGDGAHAYLDTGHRLYAAAVERSLEAMAGKDAPARPHVPLPEPMHSDILRPVRHYSFAEALDAGMTSSRPFRQETELTNPGWEISPPLYHHVPSVWRGGAGAELRFRFQGKSLMLASIWGPGSGRVECEIDGSRQEQTFFDSYCSFWRIVPVVLASGLDPDQTHEMVLRGTDGDLDKASYFQTDAKREIYTKYRDAFERPDELLIAGIYVEQGQIIP